MTENDADIRTLVEIGDTIAAVRLHRERHGGSLIDARAAIEAIRWSITQARGSELDTTGRDVDDLLRRGDRIGAIRRHREATGCSLKEMAAIEARTPAPRSGPAAGEEASTRRSGPARRSLRSSATARRPAASPRPVTSWRRGPPRSRRRQRP
jgi:ribosomal protein L7/L12